MSDNKSNLKLAVVCSSNMNRSMEAHAFLSKKGFSVDSYGTGDKVKLPGPSADRPNVYDFSVSYEHILADLTKLAGKYPDATLLAGGTDVGLWVTKAHRQLNTWVLLPVW